MKSLQQGIAQAWGMKRLAGISYLVNLVFGAMLFTPLFGMLNQYAGSSLMSGRMAKGFDGELFVEFLNVTPGAGPVITSMMFLAAGLFAIAGVFVAAGAYGLLVEREPWLMQSFLGYAGKYGGRFFRLLLWSVPLYALLYFIQFLEPLAVKVIYGSDPYQNIVVWGAAVRMLLGSFGIMLATIVIDYARIHAVRADEGRSWRSFRHGIKFTFQHFLPAVGIALAFAIPGVLLVLLPPMLATRFGFEGSAGTAVLILLQQLALFARNFLKISLFGAQASYHQSAATDVVSAEPATTSIIDPNPLLTI